MRACIQSQRAAPPLLAQHGGSRRCCAAADRAWAGTPAAAALPAAAASSLGARNDADETKNGTGSFGFDRTSNQNQPKREKGEVLKRRVPSLRRCVCVSAAMCATSTGRAQSAQERAAALAPEGSLIAGHGEAYSKSGAAQGVAEQLTLREQCLDPATWVIVSTHIAAFASPYLYGVSWRDVALVALTYNLRMFGAHPAVTAWLAVARVGWPNTSIGPQLMCQATRADLRPPKYAGITGGYHRLLSHRSFQTTRALQAR